MNAYAEKNIGQLPKNKNEIGVRKEGFTTIKQKKKQGKKSRRDMDFCF